MSTTNQPATTAQQPTPVEAVAGDEPKPRELDGPAMNTWARLRAVQAQIKSLGEEEEQLKVALRGSLGAGEYAIGGRTVFTITPGRKFSAALAEQLLTEDERAACTVTTLDRAKIERLVSPARYAEMQAESGKATVKAVGQGSK